MNDEKPPKEPFTLDVDAGTLVMILSLLILVPLLLSGFFAH